MMDGLQILGYSTALLIGLSLAMIGGGGSILTVPALVYLMGISPVVATAYSLFIVGITALVGSWRCMQQGLVAYKTALLFAIPSFIAVFLTRKFLVPAIPAHFFSIGSFEFTKNHFIMVLFGLLMMASSVSMIRSKEPESIGDAPNKPANRLGLILLEGLVVGSLTGLVGAGGGFLIIPALVLFARIPMKMAIGTSLLIIAAKSLIGFLGDIGHTEIDWWFLALFSAFAVAGILIGNYLTRFVPSDKLKPAFGWFVLVMGVYVLLSELL